MLEILLKSVASVIAPIAQGVVETVGGPQIGSVIGKLKEHFSGNDILEQAIEKSYQKALDTVEIALAGPKFYEKASTKNFASQFWQQTMTPFIESNHLNQEEFIRCCISDVELFKKNKVFRLNHFPSGILAEEVAKYSSQEKQEIVVLQDHAKNEFSYALRNITTAPHSMATLVAFRNVIMESASLHFGQLIQKDEFLFRAFFMVNQAGLKNQIQTIHEELEEARKQSNQDMILLLAKQQENALAIQAQIQDGLKYVHKDITNFFSETHQQTLAQLGTITRHLDILQKQGKETIQRLGHIEEQINSGHNIILQEIRKLQGEIQQLRSQQEPQTKKTFVQQVTINHLQENVFVKSETFSKANKPIIGFTKEVKEKVVPIKAEPAIFSHENQDFGISKTKPVFSCQENKNLKVLIEEPQPQKTITKPVIAFSNRQTDKEKNLAETARY